MIAYLSGTVAVKELESLILEVNGVGYGVLVTSEDLNRCELKKPAKLYIYEHIREQAHELFGFIEQRSKQFFEQLLDVNGVGPKMALSILNIGNIDVVKKAIAEGNVKYLQAAQGVGKRVAERIVVDLKDKVGLVSSDDATGFLSDQLPVSDDAAQALIELGFTRQDAMQALKDVDPKLSVEDRIKQALKGKF